MVKDAILEARNERKGGVMNKCRDCVEDMQLSVLSLKLLDEEEMERLFVVSCHRFRVRKKKQRGWLM